MTGQSVTGRTLRKEERLLAAVGVLLPFVSGRALAGAELVERAAVLTGRGLEEVRVLQRVASHLSPKDAQEVDRMLRAAAKGERMVESDVELLQRIAQKLERPLREAASTLRQGGKVPFLGVRKGAEGMRLVPGEPAHMAQCWVDYQFRHRQSKRACVGTALPVRRGQGASKAGSRWEHQGHARLCPLLWRAY